MLYARRFTLVEGGSVMYDSLCFSVMYDSLCFMHAALCFAALLHALPMR
jgi:hypothetical protein